MEEVEIKAAVTNIIHRADNLVGASPARGIKLLALDVDGVLTDGTVYVGPQGYEMKRFSMRDGHGIELAHRAGLKVVLFTRENPVGSELLVRTKKLGIEKKDVIIGCVCKRWELEYETEDEAGLEPHEVCFVGDDEFDVEAMEYAGFAACPADAHPTAKAAADYICENRGGHGAVREVIDMILACRR